MAFEREPASYEKTVLSDLQDAVVEHAGFGGGAPGARRGQDRTVNMGKEDFQFAASGQIPRLLDQLDTDILAAQTPCMGMAEDRLVEAITVVHVELILIHPFREGNGRLSRVLVNVMALQAGWPELDFTVWDEHKADYFAAIQAGLDDYEPMKRLVRQIADFMDTKN